MAAPKRKRGRLKGFDRKVILPLMISLEVHISSKAIVEKIIKTCFGKTNASDTVGRKRRGNKKRIVIIIPTEMFSKRSVRDFLSMSSL